MVIHKQQSRNYLLDYFWHVSGSVIGPLLFNLFFNDIPRSNYTHFKFYANESLIYSSAQNTYTLCNNIQTNFNEFMNWYNLRRFKINENKTDLVYFPKKLLYPNRITINNISIPWSHNGKYLGGHS